MRYAAMPGNNFIENEGAYQEAIDRRIKANARKGRGARWLAEDATREALVTFIESKAFGGSGFYKKLIQSYHEWGSLTDGQEAAVRKDIAGQAERKAAAAAKDAGSTHIGTIGQRMALRLTCRKHISFEGNFGPTHIYIFADQSGNLIIYKGGNIDIQDGQQVAGKATVKDHATRDGVCQTVVSRPSFELVEVTADAGATP